MAVTAEQAMAELARRELARRESATQEPPVEPGAPESRLRGMREGEKLGPGGFFDAILGIGEMGAAGLGGLAAQAVTGPLALANLLGGGLSRFAEPPGTNLNRSVNILESGQAAAQELLGPRTPEGQAIAEGLANVAEPAAGALTDAVETPFPLLSAALKTGVQGAVELGGLRGGSAALKAALPTPKPGTFIPSIKDLYAAGRVAFNEARLNGSGVRPEAMDRLRNSVLDFRNDAGIRIRFSRRQHPQAVGLVDEILDDIDNNAIDFDTLMEHREMAGGLAGNIDPALSMRGMLVKNAIDDFVNNLKPSDVISGNPQRAAQSLETARNLWRDASKAREIETRIELAGDNAGQFSGSGYENALRTQFRQLKRRITTGKEKGWTPEEIEAIDTVIQGGKLDNIYRFFGKLAPTGVVSGGIGAGLGYTAFGPIGAAVVPAGGALSRHLATQGTIGNVQRALELPLMRSVYKDL